MQQPTKRWCFSIAAAAPALDEEQTSSTTARACCRAAPPSCLSLQSLTSQRAPPDAKASHGRGQIAPGLLTATHPPPRRRPAAPPTTIPKRPPPLNLPRERPPRRGLLLLLHVRLGAVQHLQQRPRALAHRRVHERLAALYVEPDEGVEGAQRPHRALRREGGEREGPPVRAGTTLGVVWQETEAQGEKPDAPPAASASRRGA